MGQTLKELRDKMRSNNKNFLEQNKKRVNENLSVTQRPGNYLHSYILLALPSEKLNLFRVQIELNNIIDKLNKILVRDHLNLTEYLNADYQNTFNKRIEALKKETSEKYKIFSSIKVPK
ncbi:hypothetical protein [Psychrilyobacter atlanticus]|uniref:hypothetical protein n=1 Tax=Psychrilyobacter atlanticus TaxID=271091 RepID=UPI00048FC08F|nr:hypothetical protein [Psychrilyobacter atlanticus]